MRDEGLFCVFFVFLPNSTRTETKGSFYPEQIANHAVAVLPPSGSFVPVISLNVPFKFYSFIRLKVLGS